MKIGLTRRQGLFLFVYLPVGLAACIWIVSTVAPEIIATAAAGIGLIGAGVAGAWAPAGAKVKAAANSVFSVIPFLVLLTVHAWGGPFLSAHPVLAAVFLGVCIAWFAIVNVVSERAEITAQSSNNRKGHFA